MAINAPTPISIALITLSQPESFNPGRPDIAGPYLISFHLCHLGFRVNLNPEVPWLIFGFSLKLLAVLNHVPCFLPYLFPLSLGMEF